MTNRRTKESLVLMLMLLGAIFVVSTVQSLVSAGPRVNFSPDATVTISPVSGSPNSGPIGALETVTGSGFTAAGDASVSISSSGLFSPSPFSCNLSGGVIVQPCQFTVSLSAVGGTTYTVLTTGVTGGDTAIQTFTVTSPTISASPNTAAPGFFVTVSGSGYSPTDNSCTLTGSGGIGFAILSPTCSFTSPGSGTISGSFTVPAVASGIYTLTVKGSPGTDSAFTTIAIGQGATSTSVVTSYSSTTTSTSTTTTSATTTITSTSTSTSTFSSTGLSSATYTIYSTTTTAGPTTTSITNSLATALTMNVTTTGGTVFITVTIPTTVTVTGFIVGAAKQATAPDYVGLLATVSLLAWFIMRRLLG